MLATAGTKTNGAPVAQEIDGSSPLGCSEMTMLNPLSLEML
jgi:hypothetical protein